MKKTYAIHRKTAIQVIISVKNYCYPKDTLSLEKQLNNISVVFDKKYKVYNDDVLLKGNVIKSSMDFFL